jgi:hypothetical protein
VRREWDSTYPKFLKLLIFDDISSNTHEYRRFFAFCPVCPVCPFRPVCPVEPISAFYRQDGQEAVARGADYFSAKRLTRWSNLSSNTPILGGTIPLPGSFEALKDIRAEIRHNSKNRSTTCSAGRLMRCHASESETQTFLQEDPHRSPCNSRTPNCQTQILTGLPLTNSSDLNRH